MAESSSTRSPAIHEVNDVDHVPDPFLQNNNFDDATPHAHWLTTDQLLSLSQLDRMVGGWREEQLEEGYKARLSRGDWCWGVDLGLEGAAGGRTMYRFPRSAPVPRPRLRPPPPPSRSPPR